MCDHWKFVADKLGGHMLSVPTGDKWYPETSFSSQIHTARAEGRAAGLREATEMIEDALDSQDVCEAVRISLRIWAHKFRAAAERVDGGGA